MPKLYVIDGNIGVGKTTVLTALKEAGYVTFEEPVADWQPLIELRQHDEARWAFTFQTYVLVHFIKLCRQLQALTAPIVFIERCSVSSWVFTATALQDGMLTPLEYDVLRDLFTLVTFEPDETFFLSGTPATCADRIRRRGRRGEEAMTLQHLQKLHDNYETSYAQRRRYLLDCQRPTRDIVDEIIAHVTKPVV